MNPEPSILDLPPLAADLRVAYGTDPNQFADVFLPKTGSQWPAVMNIHGGYWRAKYDLRHASHFCRALAQAGIAVWCPEYRRVGNPGGGWPGTFEDILASWKRFGDFGRQHSVDASRTAVIGHSAGAQLAMALASRKPELAPKIAVSLAGVVDLQQAYDGHLSHDAVVEFLGGTPQQVPEHYAEADPIKLTITSPQLVFHGVPDDSVPVELSRAYVKIKTGLREHVEYLESNTAGHFEWIDPRTAEFRQVQTRLMAALSTRS